MSETLSNPVSRREFLRTSWEGIKMASTAYVANGVTAPIDRLNSFAQTFESLTLQEQPFSPVPELPVTSSELLDVLNKSLSKELTTQTTLDKPVVFPLSLNSSGGLQGFKNTEGESDLGQLLQGLMDGSKSILQTGGKLKLGINTHIENGVITTAAPFLEFEDEYKNANSIWFTKGSILSVNERRELYSHNPIPGIEGSVSSMRRISDEDYPSFVADFQQRYPTVSPPPPNKLFLMQEAPSTDGSDKNRIVSLAGSGQFGGFIFIDGFLNPGAKIRVEPTAEPTSTVIGYTTENQQLVETKEDRDLLRQMFANNPIGDKINYGAPIVYAKTEAPVGQSYTSDIWYAAKKEDGTLGFTYSEISQLNIVGPEITPVSNSVEAVLPLQNGEVRQMSGESLTPDGFSSGIEFKIDNKTFYIKTNVPGLTINARGTDMNLFTEIARKNHFTTITDGDVVIEIRDYAHKREEDLGPTEMSFYGPNPIQYISTHTEIPRRFIAYINTDLLEELRNDIRPNQFKETLNGIVFADLLITQGDYSNNISGIYNVVYHQYNYNPVPINFIK